MEFDMLPTDTGWIRKQFLDIRDENERFGAGRNHFLRTQPCRLGISRSISGTEFSPEVAQQHIRIKYCYNRVRFSTIHQYSSIVATRWWKSWQPIKRFGHSALIESALIECRLYRVTIFYAIPLPITGSPVSIRPPPSFTLHTGNFEQQQEF